MRAALLLAAIALPFAAPSRARAQTPDELTKLVDKLVELDSIDLAKNVKFRPGLEPPLHEMDADESTQR